MVLDCQLHAFAADSLGIRHLALVHEPLAVLLPLHHPGL
jgi:hypothetical protein